MNLVGLKWRLFSYIAYKNIGKFRSFYNKSQYKTEYIKFYVFCNFIWSGYFLYYAECFPWMVKISKNYHVKL